MLIDSHAHLNEPKLYQDLDGVLLRADQAGVKIIVNNGYDWHSSLMSLRLAEKYPQIYATVGIAPQDANTWNEEIKSKIAALAQEKKVVAIGEIGLDYHHSNGSREEQKKAFLEQISLAKELALPITIHDRDAHGDVLDIIRRENAGVNGGIFHCFSGSWEMAKECIKLGFMISFAGPVTYNNAVKLQEVAKYAPLDTIIAETDSPYLSPHPYRGKVNEPARVLFTVEKIAQIKGLSFEEIAQKTSQNAAKIYGLKL
ncbi:MAG: TatD family hydrolase [Clostridiales bacterium]